MRLIKTFASSECAIGAACHAPAVFKHSKGPDGKPIVSGKKVTVCDRVFTMRRISNYFSNVRVLRGVNPIKEEERIVVTFSVGNQIPA